MKRLLSSQWTVVYKFVFPTMWIGMFSAGTLSMWMGFFKVDGKTDPDLDWMKWQFLALTMIGTAFIYWCCIRLKKVEIDEDGFHVSNYRKTINIPISDLQDVSGSIGVNPELVWLKLKKETAFGRTIQFTPPHRTFGGFNKHPLAGQLKALIKSGDN